jgi:hypothetical protein
LRTPSRMTETNQPPLTATPSIATATASYLSNIIVLYQFNLLLATPLNSRITGNQNPSATINQSDSTWDQAHPTVKVCRF